MLFTAHRRLLAIAGAGLTALLSFIPRLALGSPRLWQPLILRGNQLPQLLNIPVNRIEVLAVHQGRLGAGGWNLWPAPRSAAHHRRDAAGGWPQRRVVDDDVRSGRANRATRAIARTRPGGGGRRPAGRCRALRLYRRGQEAAPEPGSLRRLRSAASTD